MSTTLPSGGFSIGTSSSVANVGTESNVDMALDDLIKNRRQENRQAPRRSRRGAGRKSNNSGPSDSNKPVTRSASSNKPSASARAVGGGKARRNAALQARRGIAQSTKPNAMEVDKQVYRQQRKQATQPTGRRNARRPGDVRARDKARKQAALAQPPTKKAVKAAVKAMADFGFKPPQGMQMQISFVPKPTAQTTARGTSNAGRGGGRNGGRGRGGKR